MSVRKQSCCLRVICYQLLACSFSVSNVSVAADKKSAFVDSFIRLASNATKDIVLVKIKADGLSPQELLSQKEPELKDISQPSPAGSVTFTFLKSEPPSNSTRVWFFTARIEALPALQIQKRLAQFHFETINESIEYTLTNQPISASNWTILPPPEPWVMTGWRPQNHFTAITVITGEAPATHLELKQSGLIEQTAKMPLGLDHLRLCRDQNGKTWGSDPLDLAPHTSNTLYLCVDSDFHGHGNYRGTLYIGSLEKPETQQLTLNVYSSSLPAKLLGFLIILVGVFMAWVTKVYVSNRLARDQELLPVSFLRRRLGGFGRPWRTCQRSFRAIRQPSAAKLTTC